ncbi:MAG: 50S ribosomal protein L20 [Patescibacteria group bacterium]
MSRVKKGVNANKSRRNLLKQAKGFRFGRSTKEKQAREALAHAGAYAFAHRRDKKNDYRRLWQTRISAGVVPLGLSYSKFMGALKAKGILLDRKVLAYLADKEPATLGRLVKSL